MLPSLPTQPTTFYWAWCQYRGFLRYAGLPLTSQNPVFSTLCLCHTHSKVFRAMCTVVSPGVTTWVLSSLMLWFYHAEVTSRAIWKFHRTDLDHMAKLAHLAPWCMITMGDDCLANMDFWCDFAHAIQLECTPCISSRRGRAQTFWITKDHIRVARLKRALFNRAARLQCPETLARAKAL